ncbi:hypothetical protein LXL04_011643 [Taraxacum kok-saghyz]
MDPHNEAAIPHRTKRRLKFSSPPPQSGHTTESSVTPLICNATRAYNAVDGAELDQQRHGTPPQAEKA